MYKYGVTGHVGISFVAHRQRDFVRLWIVDFDLGVSPSLCAYQLFHFLVDGELVVRSGQYFTVEGAPDTMKAPPAPRVVAPKPLALLHDEGEKGRKEGRKEGGKDLHPSHQDR